MERDKFFYAALALTLISLAYWTVYNVNAFHAYRLTTETAIATLSFYYITHLPYLLNGLQILTVGQHITPLTVGLIGPFFYFFPSSLTLMLAKALILSLSGLVVFFVARGFTKSPKFALALTFAYLINPAVIDMQLFEYHPELFIIPLSLLTFYFCMKANKKAFYISLFLLLCVFESVISIALCLGLGILAYEYIHDKDELKKERIKLAWMIVICSLLALVAYNLLYYQIQGTYSSTFPIAEEVQPFPLVPVFNHASYNYPQNYSSAYVPVYLASAIEITLLAFGMLAAIVILPTLLFLAPWLVGIFILHNTEFFYAWRLSYEVGGILIGTMLGYVTIKRIAPKLPIITIMLVMAIAMCIFTLSQPFTTPFPSRLLQPSSEMLLFQTNQSEATNLAQLRYVISTVPSNASIMAQLNLYPYFSDRQFVEPMVSSYYFRPDYIIADSNITVQLIGINESAILKNMLATGNYTLTERNGSAELYMSKH